MLLHAMREGAKSGVAKFILFGLMTLAVFGLVLMDVSGVFTNGIGGANNVATVAGQPVHAQAFDQRVRNILSRQGLDGPTAYRLGFVRQILEGEISSALIYQEAHELGLNIDNKLMARQVGELVQPYVTDGVTAKEALRRILMNQGMSEQQFVQALRMEMTNTMLRTAVLTGSGYVSPDEARDLYQHRNEKRTVSAVLLPDSAVKNAAKPSDSDLEPLYKAGQERYAIPETRRITLATLSPDSFEKTLSIEEDELKKAYEEEKDSFRLPERRMLEQSILQNEAQAKELAEQVRGGQPMKDAARKITGSGDVYLGQGEFQRDGLADDLAAAFDAKKGDVVGPVQTALGWHVVTVRDILPSAARPYAEVRDDLRRDLLQTRLADQLYELSGQIDDQIAGGASLQEVAGSAGMTMKSYGPLRADGSLPGDKEGMPDHDKDRADILRTTFELQEGEVSPVMELADGGYAVVQVDEITAKSYKPFAEARADLAAVWTADRQQALNKEKAQDALKSLASGKKSLEQIARDNGAKIQTLTLTRTGDAPAGLTPDAVTRFFQIGRGEHTMALADNGIVIGEVTGAALPAADKIAAADLEATIKSETRATQEETFQAYMAHLREEYGVKVNERALQSLYEPAKADGQL